MANTLSSTLLQGITEEAVVTVLQNRLAPLNAFSQNFSRDAMSMSTVGAGPLATIQVPYATAGSTTLTNGTNFEAGDSTLDNQPITCAQYTQPFHLTNAHLQSGHKLEHLMKINAHALADKLLDVCMALVTVATYGSAAVTSSAANFDSDDLALVWAAIEKARAKHIVLTGAYYAKFLPTNRDAFVPGADSGAYGWQGFHHTSRMVADTNVVGFGCDPSAMGVASALPLLTEEFATVINTQVIEIEGLPGLAVQFNRWLSSATRAQWNSFDIVFGAGVIDTTALKIILSAAQA